MTEIEVTQVSKMEPTAPTTQVPEPKTPKTETPTADKTETSEKIAPKLSKLIMSDSAIESAPKSSPQPKSVPPPVAKSPTLAGPTLAEAAETQKKQDSVKKQDKSNKSKVKFKKNKVVLTGGNFAEQKKAAACPVRLDIETEQDKNEKRRFSRNPRNYAGGDAGEKSEFKPRIEYKTEFSKTEYSKNTEYTKNAGDYSKPEFSNGDGEKPQRTYRPRQPLTRKLFIGGLPEDIEEDTMKEHFGEYGVVESVMLKGTRGFAFVTFETVDEARKVLQFKGHVIGEKDIICKPAINNDQQRKFNPNMPQKFPTNERSLLPPYATNQSSYPANTHPSQLGPQLNSAQPVKDTASQQKPANDQNVAAPKPDNTPQAVVETNKLFVGGLPPKTTDADLKEYFLKFGKIENVNLMIDQQTSRHRGFGFITFVEQQDARSCLDFETEHKLHDKVIDVKTAVSRTQNHVKQHSDYRPGHFHPHFNPAPFSNGPFPHPNMAPSHPVFPMMGHPSFPVPPFATGPTYHHHHNHFYIPHSPNSLQNKPPKQQQNFPQNLPNYQHKKPENISKDTTSTNLDENVNSSQLDPNSTEFTSAAVPPPPSSTENPERSNNQSPASKQNSESKNSSAAVPGAPVNQYINQQQQIMQMPNLGPHAWGGFHPQHAHQLTYAKIFVGGLKRETTKHDLEAYFSNFGKVRKLDLVMDPQDQGRNRGFAFVQYETVEACEAACGQQYHTIDGHKVEVKRAILKPPGLNNMNDTPGINPGSVYGQRVAANGFPAPFIPQMSFNPYMYQGNFGYDQQMKPGVQQNLPAPKNEDVTDSVEHKMKNGLKSERKVDENNNTVDTSI